MELRLDLALSTGSDPVPHPKTRNSDEMSFPLQHQTQESPFSNRIRDCEVKDGVVVGWPPVRSWRKQLCRHNRRACAANYVNVENSGGGGVGGWRGQNSAYVKVKMEGVGITRKIDLSVLRSHRTLASKLVSLFGKCDDEEYKLMYENKEGEWLQARDATWECFIKSVRRLKLERRMGID